MTICAQSGCAAAALSGKSHCLPHHKEQASYSYGLDHDIQQRLQAKLDPLKAQLCLDWLAALTGAGSAAGLTQGSSSAASVPERLQAALKSGVVLCSAFNAVFPGSIARIQTGSQPFVQRENLVAYLTACKAKGIRETDCFATDDLYEARNLVAVLDNLCALGQLAKERGDKGRPQLSISHGAVVGLGGASAPVNAPVPLVVPHAAAPARAQSQSGACGGCGGKRADANAKFCGQCGRAY